MKTPAASNDSNPSDEFMFRAKVTPELRSELKKLLKQCGFKNETQLMNEALTLIAIACDGIKNGEQPGLLNPETGQGRLISTPGIQYAIDHYIPEPEKPMLSLVPDSSND